MPELFLAACVIVIIAFFFSPYELTMDEEED
jgi:hypothetical protein